ncbi:hypothetical protein [Zunongwangia sp. H14]|uniref:hypothetical protein n=1 Tax=Zunongwangia sp. H14 TaxID=3240792 RepID=UPI0035652F8D
MENGTAHSPILHRAFDRRLISTTADYKVKVSALVNDKDSEFTLKQFEDQPGPAGKKGMAAINRIAERASKGSVLSESL